MKNLIKKIWLSVIGGAVGALALYVVLPATVFGGASDPVMFSSASNSNASVASASSTTVLAHNSARQYAAITNDCNYVVYLSLGGTAVKGKGIRLNAEGGSYEITPDNMFIGAITAIASTSDGTDTCRVNTVENQ